MPTIEPNYQHPISLGNLKTAVDTIKSTFVKKTGDTITGNLTATTFTEGNQLLSNKYQAKLSFDTTPTLNSTNPVTSGGVYNAIANIDKKSFVVVTDLPTTDIDTNKIYLKYIAGSKQDNYEEYVYTTTWVKIGETSLDLSGYLQLSGGTMSGTINMNNNEINNVSALYAGNSSSAYSSITSSGITSTAGGTSGTQTTISPTNIRVATRGQQTTITSSEVSTPTVQVNTIQGGTNGVTVDGSLNATTSLSEGGVALSSKYALKTVVDTIIDNTKTVEIHYFVKDGVTTDTTTNTYSTYAAVGTAIKTAIDGDIGNDITFVIHMLKTPTPSDKCIISNWGSTYLGDANRRYTIVLDGTELNEFTYTGTAGASSDDGWLIIAFVKNDTPRFTIVLNNLKFTYSATQHSRFVIHQAHAINYIFNNCKIIHAAGSTAHGVIGQTTNLSWSRMGRIIINNSILISKALWVSPSSEGGGSGYYPIIAQYDYYPQNHIFCYNSYLDHFNSPVSTTIDYTTANAAIAVMINCVVDNQEYLADDIDNGVYNNKKIGESYLLTTGGTLTGALTGTTISANSFTEGGVALSTKYQAALTFDNTPTANSNNPVKSGGIKTAIDAVASDVSALSAAINTADTGLLARVAAIENALNDINTALANS